MTALKSPPPWTPAEIAEFIRILVGHAKAAKLTMTAAALEFAEFTIREEDRNRTEKAD